MTSAEHSRSVRAAGIHEQGGRTSQRDAVYVGRALFAVADGAGSGSSAAATAISAVAELDQQDAADPRSAVDAALRQASGGIEAGDSTTLTALWFHGDKTLGVHIGDCRLHRIRDGRVELLTRDHTLVASLVEEGRLTVDEARSHPHRTLLNRALARNTVGEPDISEVDVRAGDRLAITSKGVHAVIPADRLETLLTTEADLESVTDRINEAVEGAGAPDNYSVVMVDVAD